MNNMMTRALSGAVYVAVIIACVLAGREWFLALTALLIVLSMAELQRLLCGRAMMNAAIRFCDIAMALCLLFGLYGLNSLMMPLAGLSVAAAVYVPVRIVLAVTDRTEMPGRSVLYSFLTIGYIAWPLSLLFCAYVLGSWQIVMATFVFLWLNDTGAYLSGRSFGRTKLCERLSPKKTWEGFWGGFVLTLVAGIFCGWLTAGQSASVHDYVLWGIYAAIVSVVGTFGDLFESLIKRTIGVKDSGNLIPGHGGILDRIDSLLAVAPFAALMAFLV